MHKEECHSKNEEKKKGKKTDKFDKLYNSYGKKLDNLKWQPKG